jgi:chromosome segregation ATPase
MKVLQKDKASAEKVQEYKDLLQSTTSLNESINEELKKSHKRVLELEQQLNEDRDRNRFRSEPMETKLREAEKDVMTLQGELSQNKLHLGNLTNEKRFLEIKLEELRKDRDNLASTSKAKFERYDEQLKQRDQNHATDKAYLNE